MALLLIVILPGSFGLRRLTLLIQLLAQIDEIAARNRPQQIDDAVPSRVGDGAGYRRW